MPRSVGTSSPRRTRAATSRRLKVELSVAGETRAQQLDLLHPADLGLQAISVFDAQCAELYVDAENAVAFVPVELRLLARLATTQDEMRGDLDREANALARSGPSFTGFPAETAVGRRLQSLSGSTNLDELRALSAVGEADRARMAELRSALASRETATARADAQAAEQDARQAEVLAAQLRQLDDRIAPAAVEALRAVATESATAETAVELAASGVRWFARVGRRRCRLASALAGGARVRGRGRVRISPQHRRGMSVLLAGGDTG